jgi:hypothetical protein
MLVVAVKPAVLVKRAKKTKPSPPTGWASVWSLLPTDANGHSPDSAESRTDIANRTLGAVKRSFHAVVVFMVSTEGGVTSSSTKFRQYLSTPQGHYRSWSVLWPF